MLSFNVGDVLTLPERFPNTWEVLDIDIYGQPASVMHIGSGNVFDSVDDDLKDLPWEVITRGISKAEDPKYFRVIRKIKQLHQRSYDAKTKTVSI